MEGNSAVNLMLTRDTAVASGNERVEDAKVDEHGVEGVLNGDEEVEPPHVGMVFSSQEEVRNYYIKYAQRQGFGIMPRSSRCGDEGKLTYFILACAQSGKTRSIANKKAHFRPKTNCKAKINVVVDPDGRMFVKINDQFKLHCKIFQVQDSLRHVLAKRAVEMVKSGMLKDIVAVGANHQSRFIARQFGMTTVDLNDSNDIDIVFDEVDEVDFNKNLLKCRGAVHTVQKLKDIVTVGANHQSRLMARQFGMRTVDLNDTNDIHIVFDEVDEVNFNKNLLKCRGAVHTVQKVVYSMAKACMILAEDTKVVHRLGSSIPVVPLKTTLYHIWYEQLACRNKEKIRLKFFPFVLLPVLRRLVALGGVPEIRSAVLKDGPVITDLGNVVVDVCFPNGIQNPFELEKNLNMIPGVVDNGIVTGVATVVLVAAVKDGCNVKVMDLEEFIELVKGRGYANSTT
ncbi:hypothetical protein Patl1_21168 [Pistacia atlantica]|uniref:Uncharacterized protein n=1 Tax=Pistacia atlantica TaxID=434234 RepID=A0ACC1BJF7_9ROSI|nr:hypothetical protein Patl1_21168 [Pistacia atlantica]